MVYASEQANFSVEKAARLVGLEFRMVEVDDEYRMRTGLPARRRDRGRRHRRHDGHDLGRPGARARRRCEEAGVWLHVDAAYAGSAAICPELRWCLDGCDRADSIVVNPHKWLFTPMDCSALWTRRPEAFHAAFALSREYLASTADAIDLKDYGPALGRRFRALKLWLVLRMYGAEGLRALVREHVRLAQLFASLVDADPDWEVTAPHPFSTVCFRHTDRGQLRARARRDGDGRGSSSRRRGCGVRHDPARDRERADDRGRRAPVVGGAANVRAVIFDLWETLIDWDRKAAADMVARVSEIVGDGFGERWSKSSNRYTAPIRVALADVGVPAERMEEVCALRLEYVRRCLGPRTGAVETLRELRARGHKVGLITVCSEEVETAWPESEFAGLFDAEVFSNSAGLAEAGPSDLPALLRAARVSSRTRRSSSATARTTSWRAHAASGWRRS